MGAAPKFGAGYKAPNISNMKGAKNKSMKTIKNAGGKIVRGIRQRTQSTGGDGTSSSTQEMLIMSTRGMSEVENQKQEPTVQAVTEFNSVFRVMPVQEAGEDVEPLL